MKRANDEENDPEENDPEKSPICPVGDSMVRNVVSHLNTKMSGSSQEYLKGAKIH